MANRKDPDRQKESSTAVRHGLELKLQETLSEWKERLGEKKFNKRIKKAVKAFVRDLPLTATKKVKPDNRIQQLICGRSHCSTPDQP